LNKQEISSISSHTMKNYTMKNLSLFVGLVLLAITGLSQQQNSTSHTKYPYHFKYEGNPLSRMHSATDPDVHVWNDTVWMYCSQDHEIVNGDTYATMDGYHAFSSTDLVNWTDHGEVMHSRDVAWGANGFMWAPGAAYKNGKYYLYFPHKDKTNGWCIGVAVGNTPKGPFKDIGHPIEGITGIDPAIFIDDDGQAYIYNGSHIVAKLKENMIELAEPVRKVDYGPQEILDDDLQRFHEGSYMHKKDGVYYFSYSNFKHPKFGGFYAMGDNPYGPFKWVGPMAKGPEGAQDHHSIIKFKEQWYYFYHIAVPNIPVNKTGQGRIACFERMYYNNDGTIQMIVPTQGPTKVLKTDAQNGIITLDPPGGAYAQGTKVKHTATGNLGFVFESWGGDISGSNNPEAIVMDKDKRVSASFKATPTYTLTTKSDNGTLVLNPPGAIYNAGTDVYLTPVKKFGYKFSTWGGDGYGTEVPAKINLNSNKTVIANYVAVPTYKITANAPNGIIEFDPEGESFEVGTIVKVNAKKDYGYKFSGWSGDLTGSNNSDSLIMDSNKAITANFISTDEPKVVFATNCGGKAYRSEDGIIFEADNKFTDGGIYSSGGTVLGTKDEVLHHSERMGSEFSYKIPLSNNTYQVTLMFSEIFFGSAGDRVFDVFIEGVKVSGNLDIWSKVGKNVAYNEVHQVMIKDGELNIKFKSSVENAKISAIKVAEADHSTIGEDKTK